jgi:mono/diheme cytochrome c family protein
MNRCVILSISTFLIIFLNGCEEYAMNSKQKTAISGEEIFTQSCIQCHSTDELKGGSYLLQATKLQKDYHKKENLHNYVQKNMPENAPGTLSTEEYNAVVDYIWNSK